MMLRLVSITPLGNPVVPLEYGITATASGATATSGGCVLAARSAENDGSPRTISGRSGAAVRIASTNRGTVIASVGWPTSKYFVSSWLVDSGFTIMAIAPAAIAP